MSIPGSDPTGVADSWAAFNAAAPGGLLDMGPGRFKISAPVPLPAGAVVAGLASGATTVLPATPGMACFTRTGTARAVADLTFRDFSICADNVASVTGISTVLCDAVTIENVKFYGCDINASIDRGFDLTVRGCSSIGTPHNIAGQLKVWSSVDNDYVFDALVDDYKILATAAGAVWGVKTPAVLVHRGISVFLKNQFADHLQFGPAPMTHIQIDGDSQGCKIGGVSSNGAQYGIVLKGNGGSPNWTTIEDADVDLFSAAGIYVDGCWRLHVHGGNLTAPQGVAIPCIKLVNVNDSLVEGVQMENYQSVLGTGIDMTGGGFVRVTNNTFRQMTKAIWLSGNPPGLDVQANSALSCTAGIVGPSGAGSVLSPNRGM